MKRKEIKVVLDANIFINPDARFLFGKSIEEAINNFLHLLEKKSNVTCFIPPSVFNELLNFVDIKKVSPRLSLIDRKPPSKYEISIPAILLYEFIEEIRTRINKGLRVAEKHSRKGLRGAKEEEIIKNLRNEYRLALREGIIDSKEDFDLILLSKELSAYLATSDKGVIKWAQKLGIICISAEELKNLLTN
ncbi:MAG: RNA ligase partner protein [Candidatus Omnitrophica bacterium]|nr:RNA ligase partner protein [Candidatus Omnitrophota bacterium]